MNKWIPAVGLALLFALPAPAGDSPRGILERAAAAGSFQTFLAALERAGLTTVLKGEGPFTVFAPTDAAFGKLPKDALADPERLRSILRCHIVEGRFNASALLTRETVKTTQGWQLGLTRAEGRLLVGGAKVEKADIECKNGILHIVDAVILPPEGEEFQVILEASLPEGFPGPGPVGKVVLKEYPRYRAARASGWNAFGQLFQHIRSNDIAMTAPVEMEMTGDLQRKNMAFLYGNPEMGSAGKDDAVEVLDLPAVRVLSVGIRGPMGRAKVEEAARALEAGLEGKWRRAGKMRMLGYNSPMVAAERRFWELQLPVEPIRD